MTTRSKRLTSRLARRGADPAHTHDGCRKPNSTVQPHPSAYTLLFSLEYPLATPIGKGTSPLGACPWHPSTYDHCRFSPTPLAVDCIDHASSRFRPRFTAAVLAAACSIQSPRPGHPDDPLSVTSRQTDVNNRLLNRRGPPAAIPFPFRALIDVSPVSFSCAR